MDRRPQQLGYASPPSAEAGRARLARRRAITRLIFATVLASVGLPAAGIGVLIGVNALTAGEPLGGCVAVSMTLFGGFLLTAGVMGVFGVAAELRGAAPGRSADHFGEREP